MDRQALYIWFEKKNVPPTRQVQFQAVGMFRFNTGKFPDAAIPGVGSTLTSSSSPHGDFGAAQKDPTSLLS